MKYYSFFVIFSIVLTKISANCVDHAMYQLKGAVHFLPPVSNKCMDINEKCIYVSANDPDNFRGTIGGCMTTVLQFLTTVSFHNTFDNDTFIETETLFNNYINQCNDKITVNKNFTSTTGTLSLYLSCFSQDTEFNHPNKVFFEPNTRSVSAVNCKYPWSEKEDYENIGFYEKPEEPRYCNEGYCSILKMSVYNFTTQKFYNFSRFGCLNDLYYGLDEFGLGMFDSSNPTSDFKMYNIEGASEACKSRNPYMYTKKKGDIAYIWYVNCYAPGKEIKIRNINKVFEHLINSRSSDNSRPVTKFTYTKESSCEQFSLSLILLSLSYLAYSYL